MGAGAEGLAVSWPFFVVGLIIGAVAREVWNDAWELFQLYREQR